MSNDLVPVEESAIEVVQLEPVAELPARVGVDEKIINAETDDELIAEWLCDLAGSTREKYEPTSRRFLDALALIIKARAGHSANLIDQFGPIRLARTSDVRATLDAITAGRTEGTRGQYTARIKSLFSFAKEAGYTTKNVAKLIKCKVERTSVSKRIMTEVEAAKLIDAASSDRDKLLLRVTCAAALRASEICGLTWDDVIQQSNGKVQLSIFGRGSKRREVLLPDRVGEQLLAYREADDEADHPVFKSRLTRTHLTVNGVLRLVKRTKMRAGLDKEISPHWLRHAHASHALDGGASLAQVQATLGHSNASTTSIYLHARPEDSSGLKLDESVWG